MTTYELPPTCIKLNFHNVRTEIYFAINLALNSNNFIALDGVVDGCHRTPLEQLNDNVIPIPSKHLDFNRWLEDN